MSDEAHRPLEHLKAAAAAHPAAWADIETIRAGRGNGLPTWPQRCYAPIAAGFASVMRDAPPDVLASAPLELAAAVARQAAILTGLAAWRMTKGVYRFDPDLLDALWATPLAGDIPSRILHRLPEWCVYIPLARQTAFGHLHGVFAHLEWDVNQHEHEELRLLLDLDDGLHPIPIDLGGTLREGVESVAYEGLITTRSMMSGSQVDEAVSEIVSIAEPIVSVLLYLCSDAPDISGRGRPGNPRPKRTKRGTRLFAAPRLRSWGVGGRTGAALRAPSRGTQKSGPAEGNRSSPRTHIRRAHWALRWTGPRTRQQTPILRWIAPTLVAAQGTNQELPAVVRPVHANEAA